MKAGNVILAIFIWLCIPGIALLGGLGIAIGGNPTEGAVCCIITPIILFIIGLVVLILGMEKKPNSNIIHQKGGRNCPNCDRSIPFDANICPYCKKDFNE